MGIEWIFLVLPIVAMVIAKIVYTKEVHWIEAIITVIVIAILIAAFKSIGTSFITKDTEYINNYIQRVEYYEPWDEYISRTCTRQVACGTDSNGNTQYCSESYDCSYVEYHSAKWYMVDNQNISHYIKRNKYIELVNKFSTGQKFVDMHRDYHSYDGDMYYSKYNGEVDKIETITRKHSYENRILGSKSVFNYQEIDTSDIRRYGLYDYPKIINYKQDNILGNDDKSAEVKLDHLNAKLGKKKQVTVFVLIYDADKYSQTSIDKQEALWKGGNKNEFIVCIGLSGDSVKWSRVISWNENIILNIEVRDFILDKEVLDLNSLIDYMYIKIDSEFKRKSFSDFDYIKVELSDKQLIILGVIVLILTIISFVVSIKNELKEN